MKGLKIELEEDLYKYIMFLEKMKFIQNKEQAVTKALKFFKKLSIHQWLPEVYRIEGNRIILMETGVLLGIFEFLTESEIYRLGHMTALKRKVLTPEFRDIDLVNKDNWMIVLKGLENLGWGVFSVVGNEINVKYNALPNTYLRGYLETMFNVEIEEHRTKVDGTTVFIAGKIERARAIPQTSS